MRVCVCVGVGVGGHPEKLRKFCVVLLNQLSFEPFACLGFINNIFRSPFLSPRFDP